ncbi:PP2C family serine/threonine-protein phosphatase [Cytobacillus gottheilii]|uniref:PP2C family serine/threonine-protein phosphatase n=1 Tax=Cytobacillus gottheilii TaxID=859144 RepID=UPI0024956AB3|nr:PP2C family serine/threonine-protein phosphatase [Cytobacillus gottheilii]
MTEMLNDKVEVVAFQTAKKGKDYCGDSYYYVATDEYYICVLADGLGSGQYANEASAAVTDIVEKHHNLDVDSLMNLCNQALLQKRGAAVSICKFSFAEKELTYSCVGNIRFFLYSQSEKLTYPLPVTGYLSGRKQTFNTQRFKYENKSKFLVYSDGINITGVKDLLKPFVPICHIAETIKKESATNDDDATFIIGSLL